MSRRTTQKDNVLAHLKQHGMITPLDALKLYGAFRLGAIIHTLRHEDGYNIKTTIANGDAKYAIYSLELDRTSMEQAADAEEPELTEEEIEDMYKQHQANRDTVRQEYDLIEETKRALGFGDDNE